MNKHLEKILFLGKAIGNQIKAWFMELPPYKRVVAVVGPIVIIFIAINILPSKKVDTAVADSAKSVVLASVSDLSNKVTAVPLVGQVTSINEATIRAQSGGRLTAVYKKLGDRVSAGQVIAEFQNSAERASVLQAQGQYESAKAARDIALINSANTGTSVNDVKANTLNTINSTFATLDDIVRAKTDTAFFDPRTDNPRLKLLVPDSVLQTRIENERKEIEKMLIARFSTNLTLTTSSDLISELQKVQSETQTIKNYLDDLGNAYVKALPDQNFSQLALDGQKAVISGTRTAVSGTISSLSGSKTALQNAIASNEIAGRTTGDGNAEAASADAQVKTAQGGYLGALARLENTIIRSPITGTLNSFSLKTGDYVNQTTQVAVVSNNGALEVVSYVTDSDIKRVQVGQTVLLNGKIKGVVTKAASAIDPLTKKIEVRIGIVDENSGLINGQTVKVEISNGNDNQAASTKAPASQVKIPLSAVKITPRDSYVFTLSASNTLQRVDITIGKLLGDEVEITRGLTGDMIIVKDARGLKDGEAVSLNQ